MHAYSYYPFKNRLEEVEAKDLADLKSISEGWYVEYKVQPIKIVEFAKHLSAFANQHGGWLFIGIKETSDGSRCAESFPGIDTANINNLSIQIREASSAHINPPVLYEEKIINGPCEDIGLSENKSILIVGIPKSVNTPHIHSSGRIFRRLADHSDPKPQTDRHILDDLWKRGEVHRLQVTKFLSETPPASSNSIKQSMDIYLFQARRKPAKAN
jgi:predicted HTH transcriptional regulator